MLLNDISQVKVGIPAAFLGGKVYTGCCVNESLNCNQLLTSKKVCITYYLKQAVVSKIVFHNPETTLFVYAQSD